MYNKINNVNNQYKKPKKEKKRNIQFSSAQNLFLIFNKVFITI